MQWTNAGHAVVPTASDTHSSTAFLGRSEGISVTLFSWQRKTLLEQWQIWWRHPEPKLRNASKEVRSKAIFIYLSIHLLSSCLCREKSPQISEAPHSALMRQDMPGSHDPPRDAFFFSFGHVQANSASSDFWGKISHSLVLLSWVSYTLTKGRPQIELQCMSGIFHINCTVEVSLPVTISS